MDLQGCVALVTGAAHRLGRAMAETLAEDGASIAIHYGGSREAAEAFASELGVKGIEAEPIQADLSDPEAIDALFARIDERFGRLDMLVNSAASFQKQSFDRIGLEDWEQVMAVNLRAPFLCSQAAARRIRESRRGLDAPGLIVNMVDLSGIHPWRGYVQHGVSKAGLAQLTRISARELAPALRVNAIVPGAILPPPDVSEDSEIWQRIGAASPVGRPGSPDKIQQALRFLVENDYVNGLLLPVDGGEHLLGPVNH